MPTLYNPWPEVILQLRLKKGLTQENAAEGADVASNTWHRWERPGFRPNEKQLEKILAGLGCATDELGSAFSMAMAMHYLTLFDGDGGEPGPSAAEPAPAVNAPPFPSGGGGASAGSYIDLHGAMWNEPEPDDLETLIRGTLGRSFTVVAAITKMITELITCWPRFKAEATEEDQHHVMLVRTYLHQLLDLCLSVSEELHEIARRRRIGT